MGSCALALFIHNNKCFTANLGDSRSFLFRLFPNNTIENQKMIKPLLLNEKASIPHKKEHEKTISAFPFIDDEFTIKVRIFYQYSNSSFIR